MRQITHDTYICSCRTCVLIFVRHFQSAACILNYSLSILRTVHMQSTLEVNVLTCLQINPSIDISSTDKICGSNFGCICIPCLFRQTLKSPFTKCQIKAHDKLRTYYFTRQEIGDVEPVYKMDNYINSIETFDRYFKLTLSSDKSQLKEIQT